MRDRSGLVATVVLWVGREQRAHPGERHQSWQRVELRDRVWTMPRGIEVKVAFCRAETAEIRGALRVRWEGSLAPCRPSTPQKRPCWPL